MARQLRGIRLVLLAGMFLLGRSESGDPPGRRPVGLVLPGAFRNRSGILDNSPDLPGENFGTPALARAAGGTRAGRSQPDAPGEPLIPWQPVKGGPPDILDKVRTEAGIKLTPTDFQGPGTLGTALAMADFGSFQVPSWMKVDMVPTFTLSGYNIDLDFFFRWKDWKILVSVWNEKDQYGTYPGVNLEVLEFPFWVSRTPILVSPRVQVHVVPFDEGAPLGTVTVGFLEDLTLEIPMDENCWLWMEGRDETEAIAGSFGCVPPRVTFRTGLHWTI